MSKSNCRLVVETLLAWAVFASWAVCPTALATAAVVALARSTVASASAVSATAATVAKVQDLNCWCCLLYTSDAADD